MPSTATPRLLGSCETLCRSHALVTAPPNSFPSSRFLTTSRRHANVVQADDYGDSMEFLL